jgi:NAD(P)-dependent dehydrogenase (short-subunit alcohol dehydrogenase family)
MPIAFDSPIHVADFAVNGIIRTFRLEFRKTGMKIPIIMIRCGCIKTEASDKAYNDLDKSMSEWPEEKLKLYFGALKETKDKYKSYDNKRTEPVEVAKIVYTALSAEKPRKKYRIGYLSGLSAFLEYLPQNLMDRLINLG